MPAGALIPVEHYLRSVYRPDFFRLIGNPFRVPDVIVTRGKPEEPDPEYGAAALHRDFVPERWDFSF
jgi:hypothetical protein